MMRLGVIVSFFLGVAVLAPPAAATDPTMTHMVFRFVAQGLDPDSFAATPREMWRVGSRYLRLQEQPDPDRGIHGLIISNAPDNWMIDLHAKEAMHAIDDGDEIDVSVPVFPNVGGEVVQALEFGGELDFFREQGAKDAGSGIIGGRRARAQMLIVDGVQLTLYVGMDGRPWQVAINTGQREWAIRYEVYEAGLDPDWSLFEPPESVTVIEAR